MSYRYDDCLIVTMDSLHVRRLSLEPNLIRWLRAGALLDGVRLARNDPVLIDMMVTSSLPY